jgi:hypothetical protein
MDILNSELTEESKRRKREKGEIVILNDKGLMFIIDG